MLSLTVMSSASDEGVNGGVMEFMAAAVAPLPSGGGGGGLREGWAR